MSHTNSVVNQNLDALQIPIIRGTETSQNEAIADTTLAVINVSGSNGLSRTIRVSSDIAFMWEIQLGAAGSLTNTTATGFENAGSPVVTKIPGTEDTDVADQYHFYARGIASGVAGRIAVTEVE